MTLFPVLSFAQQATTAPQMTRAELIASITARLQVLIQQYYAALQSELEAKIALQNQAISQQNVTIAQIQSNQTSGFSANPIQTSDNASEHAAASPMQTSIIVGASGSLCPGSPIITLTPQTSSLISYSIDGNTVNYISSEKKDYSGKYDPVGFLMAIDVSDPCVSKNNILFSYDSPTLRQNGVTSQAVLHSWNGPESGGIGEAAIKLDSDQDSSTGILTVIANEPGGGITTATVILNTGRL